MRKSSKGEGRWGLVIPRDEDSFIVSDMSNWVIFRCGNTNFKYSVHETRFPTSSMIKLNCNAFGFFKWWKTLSFVRYKNVTLNSPEKNELFETVRLLERPRRLQWPGWQRRPGWRLTKHSFSLIVFFLNEGLSKITECRWYNCEVSAIRFDAKEISAHLNVRMQAGIILNN